LITALSRYDGTYFSEVGAIGDSLNDGHAGALRFSAIQNPDLINFMLNLCAVEAAKEEVE
jgi:hypothetical protein